MLGEEIDCGGKNQKATSSIEELNIDEEWRILNLNNVRIFADKLETTLVT